jgi:hypothetical protein
MTTHPSPARTPSPRAPSEDPHRSLHSPTGALPGEHPGRSGNPLVKVAGLAWLEFEKPDLEAGLALVEAEAVLAELEIFFDWPTQPGGADQPGLSQHLAFGHIAVVEGQFPVLRWRRMSR